MTGEDKPPRLVKVSAPLIAVAVLMILSGATRGQEQMELSYAAGRRAFVWGEKIRVWLHLPPRVSGSGEVILSTHNGSIVKAEETVKDSERGTTFAYSIDSALLSPGGYVLQFRLGNSACESAFSIINNTPATHFPIAVEDASPQTASQSARYRDLQFNTALVSDVGNLNADALARAGMRWLRKLTVKAGSSPADARVRLAGSRHAQIAAQGAKGAWGFRGVVIDDLPPPGSTQTIDLIRIFRDESERRLAAMSLLTAASGQAEETADLIAKLKPSPAAKLLASRAEDFLLAKRFDETLQTQVRKIAEQIADKQGGDVSGRVRRLLDERRMPIYRARLTDPFADAHVAAAYRRRYGTPPPPWWEGNRNWEQWRQFLVFRTDLWPSALREWSKSVKTINAGLVFAGTARCSLSDPVGAAADFTICPIVVSPSLGALQPLFEAALARKSNADALIWMKPRALAEGADGLRGIVYGALASGASGIVYPAASADTDRHFHAAAESASLNSVITRYGDFLLALKRKPSGVAVLDSQTSRIHDLGRDPLEQKGASSYPGKLAIAWAACCRAGLVPDIVEEGSKLRQYSVVLAPSLLRLPDTAVESLAKFIKDGGVLLVDDDCKVPVEGAVRLPFAFPATAASSSIARDLGRRLREPLGRAAGRELVSSREDFLVKECRAQGAARFFWVIGLSDSIAPAAAEVTLPPGAGRVYDVFAGAEAQVISPQGDAGSSRIRVTLSMGRSKLFAVLPGGIGSITLAEPTAKDRELSIVAAILDERGAAVTAPVPASVVILDEAGAERFRVCRCFEGGKLNLTLPLGMNEPPGRWFVRVTELLSHRSQGAAFIMPDNRPADVLAPLSATDVFDRKRCTELLRRARSLMLISGKGPSREAAQDLARALQRFAIKCEIRRASQVHNVSAALATDVVLLGNPQDNLLVGRLYDLGLVPVDVGPRGPGAGRAVVFWSQSALQLGKEAITIWANDADGFARGRDALLNMCSGRGSEAPLRTTRIGPVEPVPPATVPRPAELPAALQFELGDSVTGIAVPASGRFILAASRAGEVVALTRKGMKAWPLRRDAPVRRLLLPGEGADPLICLDTAAERLSIVSTTRWRFDVPGAERGEKITVARVYAHPPLVLLATSWGRIIALDDDGAKKWEASLAGSVTAAAWARGIVAAADSTKLYAFNKRGAGIWETTFPDCSSLMLSADGRTLFAGSRSGVMKIFPLRGRTDAREYDLKDAIKSIVPTKDGRALAVSEGGCIAVVGPGKKPVIFELGHNVQLVGASHEGKCFAAASLGGAVSAFDASGVIRRFSISDAPISSIAVASDARLVWVGDWGGVVRAFMID